MAAQTPGMCEICGKPGNIHLTEINGGTKTNRTYCFEHAPQDMQALVAPSLSPANRVALLRRRLATLDQHISDPVERAEIKAEIEKMIADFEGSDEKDE